MPEFNYRDTPAPGQPGLRQYLHDRPHLPYVLPLFAFVLLMAGPMLGHLGGIDWDKLWLDYTPLLYTTKTLLAALLLWAFWRFYTPIRWTHLPLGVIVGIIGTVVWIAIEYFDQHIGLSHAPDPKTLYNPDVFLPIAWQRWLYLAVRVAGPTLVVPVMEELFFRDFLMRVAIKPDQFETVPIGTFTWPSFLLMTAAFALNHGKMWPAGAVYGILMGLLLIRTKSLGACIVAHATTNLTLYLYVIHTGDWQFM